MSNTFSLPLSYETSTSSVVELWGALMHLDLKRMACLALQLAFSPMRNIPALLLAQRMAFLSKTGKSNS
jgi:hypothetical protein